ncbi:hypothetical protein ACFDTO_25355 [Microbacteriaceae bacterium 4G12]
MAFITALIIGIACGAVPAITGAVREELEIGMFGFVASIVSATIMGFYLAIPIATLFTFFVIRGRFISKPVMAEVIPFTPRRSTEI